MALIIKTTSKTRQNVQSNSNLETKLFDFNDPSMTRSFSRCSITYAIHGNGLSPIGVYFKIDNQNTWTKFRDKDFYKNNAGHILKKTNKKILQQHFDFPKKSIGTKVQIKLCWDPGYVTNTTCKDFKLVDISFTYRGLNRK